MANIINYQKSINQCKKIIAVFAAMTLCLSLSSCNGKTANVRRNVGASEIFTEDEINDAMDCVIKEFKTFEGCELKKLWYDEKEYLRMMEYDEKGTGYMYDEKDYSNMTEEYEKGTQIILFSNFYVNSSVINSFEPDTTYRSWQWILVRDDTNSRWQVKDCGYA